MAGKLRYLLALAFVAVYFLIPAADHAQLAFLKTRAWLMDADGSPFSKALEKADRVPRLIVDLRPALEDAAAQRERVAAYERSVREWARAKKIEVDADLPPMNLLVRVGDRGYRTDLFHADPATGERREHSIEELYPGRESLVAAFLAIILAILSGKVIPSLLIGCLAGAVIHVGPLQAVSHFAWETVAVRTLGDDFRFRVMLFVFFLFAAVGVMARSGGVQGMVEWIRKFAKGPISTQICSFLIGILIFFDDYSNCVITGSTMRPLTDRNRVSREKLSYIVDSTAAPIAGISIFSTWVAYEVSMFAGQLPEVTRADGQPYAANEGFSVFIQTMPFRFYCIFTLIMVPLTILLRREFGPMLTAERRARIEGKPVADDAEPMMSKGFSNLKAPEGKPLLARNAVIPVFTLITMTVGLIIYLGYSGAGGASAMTGNFGEDARTILNNTESDKALLYGSMTTLFLAGSLALIHKVLSLREVVSSAIGSARSLLFAVVILILAWSIGHTCKDLGTAVFLTSAFHGSFEPWLLPLVMFGLASLVSFSTGTSYGTMAILLPNVVVLAHSMGETDPNIGGPALMIMTIGAVLEGSIFGDHCSPISDTTVLSSVSTASDHLHHVRTQAPYAVFTMIVAMLVGYLPAACFGVSPMISIAAGALVIALFLLIAGRRPERQSAQA